MRSISLSGSCIAKPFKAASQTLPARDPQPSPIRLLWPTSAVAKRSQPTESPSAAPLPQPNAEGAASQHASPSGSIPDCVQDNRPVSSIFEDLEPDESTPERPDTSPPGKTNAAKIQRIKHDGPASRRPRIQQRTSSASESDGSSGEESEESEEKERRRRRNASAKAVKSSDMTIEGRKRKRTPTAANPRLKIPSSYEDAGIADRYLFDKRDAGMKIPEIEPVYLRLAEWPDDAILSKATLPNRYMRMKQKFARIPDEDKPLLLMAKRKVEAEFEASKWRRIAQIVRYEGGETYDGETLRRAYRNLMAEGGLSTAHIDNPDDPDFAIDE